MNFDRCAISHSLHLPQAAVVFNAPGYTRRLQFFAKNKYPPFGEYFVLVAETGFEPATSGL